MTIEGTFTGVDGAELFFRVLPPKTAPKAAVILVHGHGDHSGGLRNLSKTMAENEYIVYAYDLRGHGKSSGKRGYIRSWDEFRGDLHEFRKKVEINHPQLPLYLIGHSIGGVIALDYALDYSLGLSGMIAISPAISYEVTAIEKLGITVMGRIKPDYSFKKPGPIRFFSKNTSRAAAKFYSDGLRHNTITPGLGRGLMQAVSRVLNQAQSIRLPLLLQYGLDDKITPPAKISHFYHQVSSQDRQKFEYVGAKHRPFEGAGKEKFLDDMVTWLDKQVDKRHKHLYN